MQEANMRWSVAQCLEIAPVLEAQKFLWFEEPTGRIAQDYLAVKKALPELVPERFLKVNIKAFDAGFAYGAKAPAGEAR